MSELSFFHALDKHLKNATIIVDHLKLAFCPLTKMNNGLLIKLNFDKSDKAIYLLSKINFLRTHIDCLYIRSIDDHLIAPNIGATTSSGSQVICRPLTIKEIVSFL